MAHNLKSPSWHDQFLDQKFGGNALGDFSTDMFGDEGLLQRAQYDTSDAALVNTVFGATVFAQYNMENNFYAAVPQVTRDEFSGMQAGDTIPKAYRARYNPVSLQTHSEGGSIPAGQTADHAEFSADVKRSETVLEVSDVQQIRSLIDDSLSFEGFMEAQMDDLDLAIDRDALTEPVQQGDGDYSSYNDITPFDRVIASSDELSNAGDNNDNTFNGSELDYGTVDRSTDTWADAYVDFETPANGNRQLTSTLMTNFVNDFNSQADVNAYEDTIILTGHDTAGVLSDLMSDRTQPRVDAGIQNADRTEVEDASTLPGLEATALNKTWDGIPIVPNQNAPSDGDLSRIYIVPTDTVNGVPRFGIEQFSNYTEVAGKQAGNALLLGEWRDAAVQSLWHEVVCRDFSSTGKLRDLME